ncbi:hypothetical protein SUGI_0457300 [Cryptomeria japonica]|nr:hypothetical protein SUGI_0457300 [Cryptomeria japonica]
MERTIETYKHMNAQNMQQNTVVADPDSQSLECWQEEARKLKEQSDSLITSIRQLMGETSTSLSIRDLQQLEIRMEKGLRCIRSKKEKMLLGEIENLQKRMEEIEGCTNITEQESISLDDVQNTQTTVLEKSAQDSNPNAVVIQTDLQLGCR